MATLASQSFNNWRLKLWVLDSLPRLRRGTAVGSQEFENDGDIHPREHQEFTKD